MKRRLTSLSELLARHEPTCATLTGVELEAQWLEQACQSLAVAARAIGASDADVRRCAFRMLIESTQRLQIAVDSCEALSYRLESGIRSIIVTGSAARCEAVSTSDVDFNVLVTDVYMSALFTRSSAKAKSSHDLLMGLERELRKKMRMEMLMREMQHRGYPEWNRPLTLKPFTREQLHDDQQRNLAIGHLLNLLFSAVPVHGETAFEDLLDELFRDPNTIFAGLLGRIALLHARGSLLQAAAEASPLSASRADGASQHSSALHAVAGVHLIAAVRGSLRR